MKKITKIVGFLLFATYLQGCVSIEPYSYKAKETDSIIIVYRKFDINACAAEAILELDGKNIAKVKTNQYYEIPIPSGPHTIVIKYALNAHRKELVFLERGQYVYEIIPNPARWASAWFPIVDYTAVETFLLEERNITQFIFVKDSLSGKRF